MTATRYEVKRYITEQFAPDVSADELDDHYDLIGHGVVTSLSLLRLIAWVGERYAVAVEEIDLEAADFQSVHAIDDFITKHSTAAS